MTQNTLATVKVCTSPEEALVIQSLLDAHDIPCWIQNYHHSSTDPTLRLALGGFNVQIPKIHTEDAKNVLRADISHIAREDVQDPCTNCGQTDFQLH